MTAEIKKLLGTDKLILGSEQVLKLLRAGGLEKIFVSSNPAPAVLQDIEKYAAMAEVTVEKLDIPNEDLGILCKKPFAVAVLGLKK